MPPARREKYDRRQREVVSIAAALFARRGFQATSMDDLSDATGLRSGGLYHYIGSKDQLLFEIFDRLMDPLLERAEAIAAGGEPPEAQLRALLRAWMTHVEAHRDHMLVFQQEWHFVAEHAEFERARAARKRFETILGELLERAVPAPDRQLVLMAVLGMVNYAPQWFDRRGRLSAVEIADGYCDLLLRASLAKKSSSMSRMSSSV
jgi:TetR/AcrR family transcriptional regulator, cholesterol catabolism regulator